MPDDQDKSQTSATDATDAPQEPQAGSEPQQQTPEPLSFEASVQALNALDVDADARQVVQQVQTSMEAEHERANKAEDMYLRAHAEMQNVRRSAEMGVQKAYLYGTEKLVGELLTTLDNLDRALGNLGESCQPQDLEGLELTRKSLWDALTRSGVQEINPEGEAFDPQKHEALTSMPSRETQPGLVLEVVQKGYTLADKVIRAAKVVISAEAAPQDTGSKND